MLVKSIPNLVNFVLIIFQSGSARVMAHDQLQSMIVVSKPSTSSLVSAYGLAKVRKSMTSSLLLDQSFLFNSAS